MRGRTKSLANEIETLMDMRTKGRPVIVYHVMSDPDVERIMRHPLTAIASDAGYVPFGEGIPHPRIYGTNARVFGVIFFLMSAMSGNHPEPSSQR